MKILIINFLGMLVFADNVFANCINQAHAQQQISRQAGALVKTKSYPCLVRNSEKQAFIPETRLCKNCGCHVSDHDDTSAAPQPPVFPIKATLVPQRLR